jgi:hypothetical protein
MWGSPNGPGSRHEGAELRRRSRIGWYTTGPESADGARSGAHTRDPGASCAAGLRPERGLVVSGAGNCAVRGSLGVRAERCGDAGSISNAATGDSRIWHHGLSLRFTPRVLTDTSEEWVTGSGTRHVGILPPGPAGWLPSSPSPRCGALPWAFLDGRLHEVGSSP